MHQNRGINRTFVPIIVRVGLTLPVFPSVYYQHRIIRHTTPGQNRYAMTFQELNLIEPLKRAVAEKGYIHIFHEFLDSFTVTLMQASEIC